MGFFEVYKVGVIKLIINFFLKVNVFFLLIELVIIYKRIEYFWK